MQSIVWQSMSNASQATSHASQATSNASQAMSNASQATSNASQATSKHIFTRSRDPEILVFLQVWPLGCTPGLASKRGFSFIEKNTKWK